MDALYDTIRRREDPAETGLSTRSLISAMGLSMRSLIALALVTSGVVLLLLLLAWLVWPRNRDEAEEIDEVVHALDEKVDG